MIEKRPLCVENGIPSNAYNLTDQERDKELEKLQQDILIKIRKNDIDEANGKNSPDYVGNKVITPVL